MIKLTKLQEATSKHIVDVFTRKPSPQTRYLLADEVGLGKTKISADVINNLSVKNDQNNFIVYYICGNERVTFQNKNKLAVDCEAIPTDNCRLSMQLEKVSAYKESDKKVIILPLTPAVTFTDNNSEFNQKEYKFLCSHYKNLICNEKMEELFKKLYKDQYESDKIEEGYNELKELMKTQSDENKQKLFKCLREIAIYEVLKNYLKPDMVILDEFQNYDGLIWDYNSEKPSYLRFKKLIDQAPYTLMLSATPFSVKTDDIHKIKFDDGLESKLDSDENQSEDIIKATTLKSAEESYNNIIKFILAGRSNQTDEEVSLYEDAFCRTERSMFYDTNNKGENIQDINPSIENAVSHMKYTNELIEISKDAFNGDDVEYASWIKVSPQPLAFATRYNGVKNVNTGLNNDHTFCECFYKELAAQHQIDYNSHAGFALLREHVLVEGVADMLWIPPVIFDCPQEYKNIGNPFFRNRDYTKTLVFCTYRMSTASTAYYMCKEAEKESGSNKEQCAESVADNKGNEEDKNYYDGIWKKPGVEENKTLREWVEESFLMPNQVIMEKVTGLKGEAAKHRYARMGDLDHVIDEFLFLNDYDTLMKNIENAKNQDSTKIYFFENQESYFPEKGGEGNPGDNRKSLGFAERFTNDKGDNNSHSRLHEQNLQFLFNSPFRPFMISASATAQEGLDFHNYSHSTAHFSMPKTPVEYQQREGRIDRYRSHLMRKRLYMWYMDYKTSNSSKPIYPIYMETLYKHADTKSDDNYKKQDKSESRPLFPNWYIGEADFNSQKVDLPKFKRLIYAIPTSQEDAYYQKLIKAIDKYQAYLGDDFENEKKTFCPYLREEN